MASCTSTRPAVPRHPTKSPLPSPRCTGRRAATSARRTRRAGAWKRWSRRLRRLGQVPRLHGRGDHLRRGHDLAQFHPVKNVRAANWRQATRSWSPGWTTTPTWRLARPCADRQLRILHADVHADTSLDLADLEARLSERTRSWPFPGRRTQRARSLTPARSGPGAPSWRAGLGGRRQYAAHEPMDVRSIGADIVTCSAYKFCGPHLGIAFGRRELLESWQPYKARPVSFEPVGHRFETGTQPYELLGGLLATFAYLDSLGGTAALAEWERRTRRAVLAGCRRAPGCTARRQWPAGYRRS